MLRPVVFNLLPSCFESLSWSTDGELAIAAADHVQILTPKPRPRDDTVHRGGAEQWTTTRLPTNVFTDAEWPQLPLQPGDVFSPGEEQSSCHVAALAWSAPGLASYGRCVLCVLTSNLLLSLWEAVDGHAQWERIAVVNHAVKDYFGRLFSEGGDDESTSQLQRKQRIRSFCWRFESESGSGSSTRTRRPSRHLLAVTNDCAEVVLLEARKKKRKPSPSLSPSRSTGNGEESVVRMEVVATCQLPRTQRDPFPAADQNSLFGLALRRWRVINHLSWGPWVDGTTTAHGGEEASGYASQIALLDGTELVMLRVETPDLNEPMAELDVRASETSSISSDIQKVTGGVELRGPLSWIHKADNDTIGLVVGALDGVVSIKFSEKDYLHPGPESSISVRKHLVSAYEAGDAAADIPDWYPITGIAQSFDAELRTPTIHITSLSSRTACLSYPAMESIPPMRGPHPTTTSDQTYDTDWRKQVDGFRNRFDLEYDLDGMSVAKTWGLATFRGGWIAACFSLHPTDMFEHVIYSQLRTRVVFARPYRGVGDGDGDGDGGFGGEEMEEEEEEEDMPWYTPTLSAETLRKARETVLSFTLDPQHRTTSFLREDPWLARLLYAAACCAVVQSNARRQDAQQLLSAASSTLQWLRSEAGSVVDLSQEVAAVHDALEATTRSESPHDEALLATPPIPAKSADQLSAAGPAATGIFEVCDVCGAGLEWYSPTESQCVEGHLFVRCGVTFLSIQDPLSAKRCSRCGTEVLRRGAAGRVIGGGDGSRDVTESMLDILLDEFETCVYCGGKFRS